VPASEREEGAIDDVATGSDAKECPCCLHRNLSWARHCRRCNFALPQPGKGPGSLRASQPQRRAASRRGRYPFVARGAALAAVVLAFGLLVPVGARWAYARKDALLAAGAAFGLLAWALPGGVRRARYAIVALAVALAALAVGGLALGLAHSLAPLSVETAARLSLPREQIPLALPLFLFVALRLLAAPHLLTHVRVERATLRVSRCFGSSPVPGDGAPAASFRAWLDRVLARFAGKPLPVVPRVLTGWLLVAGLDAATLFIAVRTLERVFEVPATAADSAAGFAGATLGALLWLAIDIAGQRALLPCAAGFFGVGDGSTKRDFLEGADWRNFYGYVGLLDVVVYLPSMLALAAACARSPFLPVVLACFFAVKLASTAACYSLSLALAVRNNRWLDRQAALLARAVVSEQDADRWDRAAERFDALERAIVALGWRPDGWLNVLAEAHARERHDETGR
jgi:hypothetical protein